MASITIKGLDEAVVHALLRRAAEHGRSLEAEIREILRNAVETPSSTRDLAAAIRARIAPLGGVDLEIAPREPMRGDDTGKA